MTFSIKELRPRWFGRGHLLLLSLISVSLLLNVVLFSGRIRCSTTESITDQVPTVFWLLLIISALLCFVTSYVWRDWRISLLMAVLYFFVFYSFNLLFRIIPTQTDIGDSAWYMWFFDHENYLDPRADSYFEYPMYFVFAALIKNSLGLGNIGTINIGFFLVILLYPIALVTLVHKGVKGHNTFQLFYYPAMYLIMIFFYFNDQFVPQFMGLFFLIGAVGMYTQLIETKDVRFYYLSILMYIACIFAHPFIFFFFILGVFFYKAYLLLKLGINWPTKIDMGSESRSVLQLFGDILSKRRTLIPAIFKKFWIVPGRFFLRYIGKEEKRGISLLLLLGIYSIGYLWRFSSVIDVEIERALSPTSNEGGSWVLVQYITGNKPALGTSAIAPLPLFELIPKWEYLMSRYVIFAMLVILFLIMVYSILKIERKRMVAFDFTFIFGSIIFLIVGFFTPNILGQRSTQTIFLTPSKYFLQIKGFLFTVVSIIIIISPILYTYNVSINYSLDGNMFVEDDSTIGPGQFTQEYRPENITVMTPDRRFYPVTLTRYYREQGYFNINPYTFADPEGIDIDDSDIIIMSSKLSNRMDYFQIQYKLDILNNCSCVYDQGGGKIFLVP